MTVTRAALPEPLVSRLHAVGLDPAAVRIDEWALGLGNVARAFGPDIVVEVALSDRGRADLRAEERGRRWAEEQGITTPRILDHGADWMVGERWQAHPWASGEALVGALDTADRIGAAQVPGWAGTAGDRWRAPARGRARRAARLVLGGMRLPEFTRARRVAAGLPRVAPAHGDFHRGNLLFDVGRGAVAVIDWTHLAPAPRHTDLLRLWGQLPRDEDAAMVAEAVLARTSSADRAEVGALWHWLALRQLAEHLSGPVETPADDYADLLRRRLREARVFARDLGSLSVR